MSKKPVSTGEPVVAAPSDPTRPPPSARADPRPRARAPAAAAAPLPSNEGRVSPETNLRLGGQGIKIGDVLNHMFEVRRFIARGGMGEVFEGINISTSEPVAIKVMLPTLAADAAIQALFLREARTLTRLSSPALVQYRVMAQEPKLGVLYIVTDFIPGPSIADVLGVLKPTVDELFELTRRLADGLRTAHELGAIHRDVSPDNVLLEGGKLAGAKIIDFGIAKDVTPGSKTIVGDGFAGKLNYVAPEQLGDFDRMVGPWTDVYSLGLVILALAQGRNVDLSGAWVDAINKRRAGVDLSGAPVELRRLLGMMLSPDPANRLRSMSSVIRALDVPPKEERTGRPGLLVVAAGAIVLLGIGGYLVSRQVGPGTAVAPAVADSGPATPAAAARTTIAALLPDIACSWLDISDVRTSGEGVTVTLRGAANTLAVVRSSIAMSLASKDIALASIDADGVAKVPESACVRLDAFRAIRAPGPPRLSAERAQWQMSRATDGSKMVQIPFDLDLGPKGTGDALFSQRQDGAITKVADTRAQLEGYASGPNGKPLAENRYRVTFKMDELGWSGLLLLRGAEPFDAALIAAPRPDAAWKKRFLAAAGAGGWQSEMVWTYVTDAGPG